MSDIGTSSAWARFWDHGRWWKASLVVVVYLALYLLGSRGVGAAFGSLVDGEDVFATPASVFISIGAPLVIGAILLIAFLLSTGWVKPIFARQPIGGRWWMWIFVVLTVIPIVLRLIGIEYGNYADGVVATSFAVGLLIGFTEELLYRGIVVKILRSAGHREWTVAVLSSLFFALSHSVNLISGQPITTVAVTVAFTFGFGMMMYLALHVTGNIIWPMLIHAATDPTTFLGVGGVDAHGAAATTNTFIALAGPFSFIFIAAALLAMIFIRGRVTPKSEVLA